MAASTAGRDHDGNGARTRSASSSQAPEGVSRRRFIGSLIAAPPVAAGAELFTPVAARAAVPTGQPVDRYDLTDLLTDATKPTAHLITVVVNSDGTVSFALP